MTKLNIVEIVEIMPTKIWIEDDLFGSRHVVMQHEGCDPFVYASFHYDYRYTSNSSTYRAAHDLAKSLGAVEPIEHKGRDLSLELKEGWPEDD